MKNKDILIITAGDVRKSKGNFDNKVCALHNAAARHFMCDVNVGFNVIHLSNGRKYDIDHWYFISDFEDDWNFVNKHPELKEDFIIRKFNYKQYE